MPGLLSETLNFLGHLLCELMMTFISRGVLDEVRAALEREGLENGQEICGASVGPSAHLQLTSVSSLGV